MSLNYYDRKTKAVQDIEQYIHAGKSDEEINIIVFKEFGFGDKTITQLMEKAKISIRYSIQVKE